MQTSTSSVDFSAIQRRDSEKAVAQNRWNKLDRNRRNWLQDQTKFMEIEELPSQGESMDVEIEASTRAVVTLTIQVEYR